MAGTGREIVGKACLPCPSVRLFFAPPDERIYENYGNEHGGDNAHDHHHDDCGIVCGGSLQFENLGFDIHQNSGVTPFIYGAGGVTSTYPAQKQAGSRVAL
jgi:hypothetical protein